jgi:hypothetical protein
MIQRPNRASADTSLLQSNESSVGLGQEAEQLTTEESTKISILNEPVFESAADVFPHHEMAATTALELEPAPALEPQSHDTATMMTDELAPELQTASLDKANSTVRLSRNLYSEADRRQVSSVSFTPYESPLKMFKAYRYHSNFPKDVAGGIQSITYSNNIDVHQPVCQFEMAGGTCNDPNCAGQHFKSMTLRGE